MSAEPTSPRRLQVKVPAGVLKPHLKALITFLRLGALVNALHMQIVATLRVEETGSGAERDRLQFFLASVGYYKEALDMIEQVRPTIRDYLARARSNPTIEANLPKWSEVEPHLSRGPGSVYELTAERLRHLVAFHVKERAITDWLRLARTTRY